MNLAIDFSICLPLNDIIRTFSNVLTLYSICVMNSSFTRQDTANIFLLKDRRLKHPINERITYTRDMRPSELDDTLRFWVNPT